MITPRGLARFQSIPDSYALPEDNPRLACEIIGNGVPSKMYEVIAKAFLSYYA
jgi:site-specific DNA-cytosine methylase